MVPHKLPRNEWNTCRTWVDETRQNWQFMEPLQCRWRIRKSRGLFLFHDLCGFPSGCPLPLPGGLLPRYPWVKAERVPTGRWREQRDSRLVSKHTPGRGCTFHSPSLSVSWEASPAQLLLHLHTLPLLRDGFQHQLWAKPPSSFVFCSHHTRAYLFFLHILSSSVTLQWLYVFNLRLSLHACIPISQRTGGAWHTSVPSQSRKVTWMWELPNNICQINGLNIN